MALLLRHASKALDVWLRDRLVHFIEQYGRLLDWLLPVTAQWDSNGHTQGRLYARPGKHLRSVWSRGRVSAGIRLSETKSGVRAVSSWHRV